MRRFAFWLLFASGIFLYPACGESGKSDEKEKVEDKIAATEVPQSVVSSFNQRYPGAHNIEWEQAHENGQPTYKVKFKNVGRKMKAEFATDGKFIKEKQTDDDDAEKDKADKEK